MARRASHDKLQLVTSYTTQGQGANVPGGKPRHQELYDVKTPYGSLSEDNAINLFSCQPWRAGEETKMGEQSW